MSHSYPGGDLSAEQLVYAFAQVSDPNSLVRRSLFDLGPQKIHNIERDLSEVLKIIRAFKNIYVPANKLSSGILSRVLKYRTCERDLITATHVCRHWRSALIGDPSLWTPPPIEFGPYLHRTLTYLERSESDEINADVTSLRDLDTLQYLTPHIARSRSLIIKSYQNSVVRLPDDFPGHQASLLHSISFTGICPTFESPSPLPNLTKFSLHLHQGGGSVSMSLLFRFLSNSPLLESITIIADGQTTKDVLMDQVISMESLMELTYGCNIVGRILPFLRLPCLKKLHVPILQESGQIQKLVDILPHNGRTLLATVTVMIYRLHASTLKLYLLSRDGPSLALTINRHTPFNIVDAVSDPTLIDWFSSQGCIPWRQITLLVVNAPTAFVVFPIDAFALENLEKLEVDLRDAENVGRVLRSFRPDTQAGVPCRSLQVIRCTCRGFPGPLLEPLMSLVKEREGAGYQLGDLRLLIEGEFDPHFLEELREHVGELKVEDFVE